ncbi:hypothetical protein PR048_014699 [Dryococelus australis]|uniref:Uncharacterized protein n=1 Tax=Dryococelus australis TaxID=614101 RepID=A0ABQ9HF55_9NEOP|nr:hypothetical protein PR048_014699 [Dryococelus australis]
MNDFYPYGDINWPAIVCVNPQNLPLPPETIEITQLSEQEVRDELQKNLVGQRLKIAADRRSRYYKTLNQKALEIGTLVLVRAENIIKMRNFVCAKLMPLFTGLFVVSGRKNENCYELNDPATGELFGSYNLRQLKPYHAPLMAEV